MSATIHYYRSKAAHMGDPLEDPPGAELVLLIIVIYLMWRGLYG